MGAKMLMETRKRLAVGFGAAAIAAAAGGLLIDAGPWRPMLARIPLIVACLTFALLSAYNWRLQRGRSSASGAVLNTSGRWAVGALGLAVIAAAAWLALELR